MDKEEIINLSKINDNLRRCHRYENKTTKTDKTIFKRRIWHR